MKNEKEKTGLYFSRKQTTTGPNYRKWQVLYDLASYDYVSFLVIESIYRSMGTSLWMLAQSLEKYLKSWLLRGGMEEKELRDIGHNIEQLWNECRKQYEMDFEYLKFDSDLALDMNNISANSRYGDDIIATPGDLFDRVIPFFNELRKRILKERYNNELYGIHSTVLSHQAHCDTIDLDWIKGRYAAKEIFLFLHKKHLPSGDTTYWYPKEDELNKLTRHRHLKSFPSPFSTSSTQSPPKSKLPPTHGPR